MAGAGTQGAATNRPAVNMQMAMAATVCTVLAIVLIAVAIATPWYAISTAGSGFSASSNSGFSGTSETMGNESHTQTWANYTEEYKAEHNGTAPQLAGVYSTTMDLLVGGIVFAALGILTGWMAGQGKLKPVVPALVSILALLLTLGGFGYFAASHQAAMSADMGADAPPFDGPWKSFTGTTSQGGATAAWGPAIGYWLALGAAILIIVSMVLGIRSMPMAKKPDESRIA